MRCRGRRLNDWLDEKGKGGFSCWQLLHYQRHIWLNNQSDITVKWIRFLMSVSDRIYPCALFVKQDQIRTGGMFTTHSQEHIIIQKISRSVMPKSSAQSSFRKGSIFRDSFGQFWTVLGVSGEQPSESLRPRFSQLSRILSVDH